MRASSHHWPNLLALALGLVLGAGCTNASKARRLLADADRDFQAQKYDAAELEYQSALRFSPLNPAAIRQLGFIYFEEGRPQSFVFLKKALELEPKNPQTELKLAEDYGHGNKPKEAIQLLNQVLESDPANEHAWHMLAELAATNELSSLGQRLETQLREGGEGAAACHSALGWIDFRMGKTNEAQTEFDKAFTLDPKLVSPFQGRAMLCALHKDIKGLGQALKTAAELSPVRSPVRMRYVDFELQNGAAEEAKEMLRRITRQAPDYLPAWLDLAKISYGEHKYDECKAALDKILTRDSGNFDAAVQLGTLALAQRDAQQALLIFQRLDEAHKNMPTLKYHLALAHLQTNEKQKAMANLKEVLALDRNYSPAVLLLAELAFRSGQLTEAINLLSQQAKNHPENTQVELALAEAYLAQNQPAHALEVYQRLARMFPKNAEFPRRMGAVCERMHDLAQARADFEQSLGLDPNYFPTLQQMTVLDIYEKRFDDAHHLVDGVMAKNPKAAEPLVLQGDIYLHEGQTNQAASSYSKAIELNPDQPLAYLDLASLYLSSHQEQQALTSLTNLVAITNNVQAMMMIGVIHQTAGRYEQACDAFQKLLAVSPKNAQAMNCLAYVDSEFMGKIEPALKLAETARQLKPNDPFIADTLGWILFKKHEYAHALSLFRESADKQLGQPGEAEVQMHLGLAYYMMGEEEPARLSLRQALDSRKDFPGKDLARRRLEVLDIDPTNTNPAMVQQLRAMVQEDPQDPVPLSRLASIQEQTGEVQAAADSLQTLLSINPQDWPAMIRLARLYADRLKNLRKGLDLAKSAHTLAPEDGHASAMLGELVYRSGDYPWALSLLEQAANQASDPPSVFFHLALAYYAVGRVADADTAMQKAVRLGEAQPYLDQAKQFLDLRAAVKDTNQIQAAGALAREALAKNPDYVPALMVSALLAEGRGATNEAEQMCQKVLSLYPLFAPASRELALLYSQSKSSSDLDKAYEFGEKARASMPDDLALAKTLGLMAYRRADYARSMSLLRESAEKHGDDGESFYYLGLDYYQLKQTNQSKLALQRSLDLHLSDDLATKARSILGQMK